MLPNDLRRRYEISKGNASAGRRRSSKARNGEISVRTVRTRVRSSRTTAGVIGAVDGTHIPIHKPAEDGNPYYNRKGTTSINVLGVVDFRRRFTYVRVGEPGMLYS
jgi:DDE superfamily endonuclease